MDPEIIVTIEPNGEVNIKVQGVAGPACTALTKGLVAGAVLEQKKTSEYHEVAETNVSQQMKLGG
jgi:hypothetical protein